MTDFLLLEKLQLMIKNNKKPRLLCKKGITTGGYFRPYMSFSEYTESPVFRDINEITPVTVRFSSMLGDKGTADTVRNIKFMNIKFLRGNKSYDMICQSIPSLMINDKNSIIRAADTFRKKEWFDGINKAEFWKFVSEEPDSLIFAVMLYSHMGIAGSFININMFSVNRSIWNNQYGDIFIVRYKWIPVIDDNKEGKTIHKPLNRNAAEFIAGYDPDIAYNEISDRINKKKYPMFELLMKISKANDAIIDKHNTELMLWDESDIPYTRAGIMILDHIKDHHEEDCIWFSLTNTLEGISIYKDSFTEILDYITKTQAIERGTYK